MYTASVAEMDRESWSATVVLHDHHPGFLLTPVYDPHVVAAEDGHFALVAAVATVARSACIPTGRRPHEFPAIQQAWAGDHRDVGSGHQFGTRCDTARLCCDLAVGDIKGWPVTGFERQLVSAKREAADTKAAVKNGAGIAQCGKWLEVQRG